MNVLGICAGSGALELGLGTAEPTARGVCYVERESYAASLLVSRMEEGWLDPAPVWSDLGTFDGKPWRGIVDCIASGDPCQPNSVAGQRKGSEDDRWLIDQLLRVVAEVRPRYVFREQAEADQPLLASDDGDGAGVDRQQGIASDRAFHHDAVVLHDPAPDQEVL